jgi:hypothetical protein
MFSALTNKKAPGYLALQLSAIKKTTQKTAQNPPAPNPSQTAAFIRLG